MLTHQAISNIKRISKISVGKTGHKMVGLVGHFGSSATVGKYRNQNHPGNIANYYNVYYRVHAKLWLAGLGSNGQDAGTSGYGYRLEGMQVVLVPKGQPAPGDTTKPSYTRKPDPSIHYQTNVQNIGWQNSVADGGTAGTTGQALRVEAFKANVSDLPDNMSGGVTYKAYVQNIGWQSAVSDNDVAGTSGQGLQVEALSFNLTGTLSNSYDIYYRTYVQNYGWLGWASNGQTAGTAGRGLRIDRSKYN